MSEDPALPSRLPVKVRRAHSSWLSYAIAVAASYLYPLVSGWPLGYLALIALWWFLAVVGIVSGLETLWAVRRYGRKGLLLPAVIGLVIWTVVIALSIPVRPNIIRNTTNRISSLAASTDRGRWGDINRILTDRSLSREDAILVAQKFLTHPDVEVRYEIAMNLYKLGDRSGADVLIAVINSSEPVMRRGFDLRLSAASFLAEYREFRGRDAVAQLYLKTKNVTVWYSAVVLGSQTLVPDLLTKLKRVNIYGQYFEAAAILNVREAIPIILEYYQKEDVKPHLKMDAAGAMIRFGQMNPYEDYILGLLSAYAADKRKIKASETQLLVRKGLMSLGPTRSPKLRPVLEQLLDDSDSDIGDMAFVQLICNHPDSKIGRDRLIRYARHGGGNVTNVNRLAVASVVPEIRAAANDRMFWGRAVRKKDWDQGVWLRANGVEW